VLVNTAPATQPKPLLARQELDYEKLYQDIERWEGVVLHMYLDNAKIPKVTVGTGNMLPNIAAAQALPFMNTATNKVATAEEVANAFTTVSGMKHNMRAKNYKINPSIEIPQAKAKELAMTRLKGEFIPKLRSHFKDFDKYPVPAREALIDMVYNMGIGEATVRDAKGNVVKKGKGLLMFGTLHKDCNAGDWHAAATACKRANPDNNPHTTERNDWTRDLFEKAERITPHGKQIGAPH
jgi:GH24 family phage-related lysozyme (muramidase)